MRYLFLLAFFAWRAGVCVAQEQEQPPKPSTKIEAFQAKTGVVIIRGFTTIGSIQGLAGSVTVDAREFRDGSNPNSRVTGIGISVTEAKRPESESTSFIDADEVDSLLQGLDYISKADKDITSFETFEAEYRTKGDFRLVVFNSRITGRLSVTISSGRLRRTTVYANLAQLLELRQLIVTAKSKL